MATMVGRQSDMVAALCAEIELDFDAIEAYGAAIERLSEATDRTRFQEFREDHRRHVEELSAFVVKLGGTPPTKPDAKALLTKGKVVILALIGTRGVLEAMRSNEGDTNVAYERLCARPEWSGEILLCLRRALADERRHREYIETRLGRLPASRESRPSAPSHP